MPDKVFELITADGYWHSVLKWLAKNVICPIVGHDEVVIVRGYGYAKKLYRMNFITTRQCLRCWRTTDEAH